MVDCHPFLVHQFFPQKCIFTGIRENAGETTLAAEFVSYREYALEILIELHYIHLLPQAIYFKLYICKKNLVVKLSKLSKLSRHATNIQGRKANKDVISNG